MATKTFLRRRRVRAHYTGRRAVLAKAGVEALVKVFANELRGRNISVNAVAPGPVATELFYQGKSEELVAQIVVQVKSQRDTPRLSL
jgi:NAD(P)-dependent dehydrogenase (short-subunit alcohol dehydrogenase family)